MSDDSTLPQLSPVEIRVLGALMEKSVATPDYYPMTLNGLTAACNQKTSRNPVTNYSEEEIQDALNGLKARSFAATATGGGSRVMKYKHNFGIVYPVSDGALAVMCLLFLRGPQTPGELNTNSGRLYQFSSLESVHKVLEELGSHSPPFIRQLPRAAGQKEARFTHLFTELSDVYPTHPQAEERITEPALEERVRELERQVALLNAIVARLNGDGG